MAAKKIQDCDKLGDVSTIDDEIRLINAKIANRLVFRSTKYESYWTQLETD